MKIKRMGILTCAFVVLFSLLSVLVPLENVEAADKATFIDKVSIVYKGATYTDGNPYDSDHTYFGGPGSCRHLMQVDWGSNTADIVLGHVQTNGHCANYAHNTSEVTSDQRFSNVDITNSRTKEWNAYRISEDVIFLPIGAAEGGCVTGGPAGGGPELDLKLDDHSDTMERKPPDEEPHRNYYYENNENGTRNDEIRIETSGDGKTAEFSIVTTCALSGQRHNHGGIVIAFDGHATTGESGSCVPTHYTINSGACADDDPSDPSTGPGGGANGDTPPSCESKNTNELLAWMLCSVVNFFDNSIQKMGEAVDGLLSIKKERYEDPQLRKAWSYFRNIASLMLIIIGLIMVIGQAVSKE